MAANIKEFAEGEADELCHYQTTRSLAKGEELLLLREDSERKRSTTRAVRKRWMR